VAYVVGERPSAFDFFDAIQHHIMRPDGSRVAPEDWGETCPVCGHEIACSTLTIEWAAIERCGYRMGRST
jgi:hypothetical protein